MITPPAILSRLIFPIVALFAAGSLSATEDRDFTSKYLSVSLAPTTPAFAAFGTDSLGRGENLENLLLTAKLPAGDFALERDGNRFLYRRAGQVAWTVELQEQKILLHSRYAGSEGTAFLLLIDQKKNHATLLARPVAEAGKFAVPAVLHFPDRGTFRVTATAGATLEADARRRQPEAFVRVSFPAATAEQPEVAYVLESTLIHPALRGLSDAPLYDGYRRNFLNLIQFHPRLRTLANNSSSDACGFCFWQYAELAREAPPLAPGLTVMDLVRISLERVFNGGLTYGQVGYRASPEQPEAAPWSPPFDSLDTLPSFVIAGSLAITEGGDAEWGQRRFDHLVGLARKMLAQDRDGNGLIEYPLSGNSGSWDGSVKTRPANWWDTIGFGYEDGFSNALAYHACLRLAEAAAKIGRAAEAKEFTVAAARIKRAYYPTLFNPRTGILAGWKSADGELHDYWFTFINGMAIAFGLVEGKEADVILDRLRAKMNEVGFRRFDLGLPGNLVFIHSKDYTDRRRRYGGSEQGDGSDSFQIYENGAATHCHAYWLVQAFYRQGRVADARRIYHPMLQTFAAGGFQGFGKNGQSNDWRNWDGECSGYEGYLSDGYLALLGVRTDLKAGK